MVKTMALLGCLLALIACEGKDIRKADAEMLRFFDVDSAGQVKAKIDSLKSVGFVKEVALKQCPDAEEFMRDASGIGDSTEYVCLRVEKEKSLFYFVDNHFNTRGPCVSFIHLINSKGFVLKWKNLGERCAEMSVPGP